MTKNNGLGFMINLQSSDITEKIGARLSRICVNSYIEPPCSFEITFSDKQINQKGIEEIQEILTEGMQIDIGLGYGSAVSTVISGDISAVEAQYVNNEQVSFIITGYDFIHRLSRGTASRVFEGQEAGSGMPDSMIAEQLASEFGLAAVTDATPELKKARVQNNISNLAFLQSLAEINGFYIWMENNKLCFKKSRPANQTLTLEWGKNLLSFNPRLSIAGLVNNYRILGWDEKERQEIDYSKGLSSKCLRKLSSSGIDMISKGAGGDSMYIVGRPEIYDQKAAENYAHKLVNTSEGIITASGMMKGDPYANAGNKLDIKNTGRFSGEYVITEARHVLDGIMGYHTGFTARSVF